MASEGKLEKVDIPTAWCNNMTVREKSLPDGKTKLCICLDPSQAVNKAIKIPHYQIPTTAELLPLLAGDRYKTFSIFDALDGFIQVELDNESSLLTLCTHLEEDISGADLQLTRRIPDENA